MSWPTFYPLYSYTISIGQILGLVACTVWFTQLFGQIIYTYWCHTHRNAATIPMLKFIPPAEYAFFRAWAGLALALLNLSQGMLNTNIALVVQPELLILFGLFEWASRNGMDGQHKVVVTIWTLLGMAALQTGILYISQDIPAVLLVLCIPLLITIFGAGSSLVYAIKEKHRTSGPCVAFMLLAVVGDATSIASVLYTPWYRLEFGYATLAIYSIDTTLWLGALLGASYTKAHPKAVQEELLYPVSV